jgi:general secretion pathway protein D
LAFAFWAAFAPVAAAADDTVTLNFVNADIEAVVKAVAEITGRNFLIDPRVKGSINIISARPVPKSLVYPTLLSALRLQGFAVVEGDGVVKIVPEADAQAARAGRWRWGRFRRRRSAGHSGDHAQVRVRRRSSSTCCVRSLLRTTRLPRFPGSNALVITDYADNLRRIDRIIARSIRRPARSLFSCRCATRRRSTSSRC